MTRKADATLVPRNRMKRGADGIRRMVYDEHEAGDRGTLAAQQSARGPGRPRKAASQDMHVKLTLGQMRLLHDTLQAALDAPRAVETQRLAGDAASWIKGLLGPLADPDYVPPPTHVSVKYAVTGWNGVELTYDTLQAAAQAYGVKPQSLNVALSRGGGECRAMGRYEGNPAEKRCKKVLVYAKD